VSPRTLVLLALVSVGLLGLALWEILGESPSQPLVSAEKGDEDEPAPEGEHGLATDTRDEPRLARESLLRAARAADDLVDAATEEDAEPQKRGPGEVTGQAPTLEEAREGFANVMEELALVAKRRRRISQKQWERHYREANDAFAALSSRLRAGDEKDRDELENAHKLLKERLGRLRVRGKKHEAP